MVRKAPQRAAGKGEPHKPHVVVRRKPGRRSKAEVAGLPEFAKGWKMRPFYSTEKGLAIHGDALVALKALPPKSVRLIFTSPPYALQKAKPYGNEKQEDYLKWFRKFVPEFKRILKEDGSLVINVGGAWMPGHPVRSLYHYELLIDLVKNQKFHLAQDFFWYNPAKMPNPAQWVNIDRIRVKDAVEPIWWLSLSERPLARNREVLTAYTESMRYLLKNGYNDGRRPSGWVVSKVWGKDNGGAIPPNVLLAPMFETPEQELAMQALLSNVIAVPNTDSNSRYQRLARENDLDLHPARFPNALPEFFIKFLTEPGDLVVDPFAGSNATGEMAEILGRNWVAVDMQEEYLAASSFRFEKLRHSVSTAAIDRARAKAAEAKARRTKTTKD